MLWSHEILLFTQRKLPTTSLFPTSLKIHINLTFLDVDSVNGGTIINVFVLVAVLKMINKLPDRFPNYHKQPECFSKQLTLNKLEVMAQKST